MAPDGSSCSDLIIGADVGSTTVKCVVVDPATQDVLWTAYQRHEARQASALADQLGSIEKEYPAHTPARFRIFLTGSGAAPLVAPLGAKFVQEVNAVTLAVEALHPDVGSIIELGGQDAKIVIYKPTATPGVRRVVASMNDKCASGTGSTIDKCLIKVGMSSAELYELRWNAAKIHHVAAKCGVFAETDIVNLIKSGIPAAEVICSLADAIVTQNLSVLTRGNTLRHRVLLLGGPNRYLPVLQACWRQRILETWRERDYALPPDQAPEALIFVPERAELYAAVGAALFGLHQDAAVGRYRGVAAFIENSSQSGASRSGAPVGPALVQSAQEGLDFVAKYRVRPFRSAPFTAGEPLRGYLGIDGGSTSSKAMLVSTAGEVLLKHYQLSRGNPLADAQDIFARLRGSAAECGSTLELLGLGVTGYAADVLEQTFAADASIVETVAHVEAARHFFPEADVVCDVGGQDIKVLLLQNGRIRNFRLSNQCSAGNGMLLQAMAGQFGIALEEYADVAFSATRTPIFNYGCAVFLDTDRVTFQKEGFKAEELLAGLALVLPKNIWQYVVQIPRLGELGSTFVLQGGTQYNLAAVKAQHDYIRERVPNARVHVHPHCGEAGALGAALEAKRSVEQRAGSRFIGLDAALALRYTTRNDAGTVCHFCPNECKRTFIEATTPTGHLTRYIAGFSCENGTVESKEELRKVAQHRKSLRATFPNLVQYEAELAFKTFFTPAPLPAGGSRESRGPSRGLLSPAWSRFARRAAPAAGNEAHPESHRAQIRISMPRVLNMYSTGPLWRAYFETLGIPRDHIRFSGFTTEESWQAGARYGSIDPCFPAKVVQAHIHELLSPSRKRTPGPEYLFFPCITRLPSFVRGMPDMTACPVVAGTPKVMRAAFTKETDYFARAGVEYIDSAMTITEPTLLRRQMYETWGARLKVSEAQSDFAVGQGIEALRRFDEELRERGAQVLEELERDHRVGILLLARPYHGDPGLNHDLLEEFQALGYPILSVRSIPKDPAWLRRFFPESVTDSPLDVRDVWPEAYSTNSAEKVWAAKFAARHPNLVVLDLSSFKCGNDAPSYGLIDRIIAASSTPYAAIHDIDANKPAGSMKIRVRTYEYTLRRHAEALQARAAKRSELERRVAERRAELYEQRRRAIAALSQVDATRRTQQQQFDNAFGEYLMHEPVLRIGRVAEPERGACRSDGAVPEQVIHWRPRIRSSADATTRGT